jgi:O-antigen ligase
MSRFLAVALMIGVTAAVLAFGGTEPVSLCVIEIFFFALAALLALKPDLIKSVLTLRTVAVPCVLVGIVFIQLCPLPTPTVAAATGIAAGPLGLRRAHWSIVPYETRKAVLIMLTCVIVFLLAQVVAHQRAGKKSIVLFIMGLGTLEALYGMTQYLSGWQNIFTYAKKYDLEEATGTYINRNHYAGLLEMAIPFAIAFVMYEYGRLRRLPPRSISKLRSILIAPERHRPLLYIFLTSLLFVALFFSRSRMGILSCTFSVALMLTLAAFRHRRGIALLAVPATMCIAATLWIGPASTLARFKTVDHEFTGNAESRVSIWRDALPLIRQHPLLGTGLGTFPLAFTAVQTGFLGQFVNHAHNDYIELAIDLGIPTALVLFASVSIVLAGAIKTYVRAERESDGLVALGCSGSILALLLHSFTDFNLYIPANAMLFSMILGVANATNAPAGPNAAPSRVSLSG